MANVYSQDYNDYSGDYQDYEYANYNEMDFNPQEDNLMKANSVPIPTPDPVETRKIDCERILYETLSVEIENEAEKITKNVELIKEYRFDIKSQLENIAIETFHKQHKNVEAHIYGSVATGLALTESDMDIVITGINSFDSKENHLNNISSLFDSIQSTFNNKILIKSLKILYTQVPIIKLKFSLSDYFDERIKQDPNALPFVNFESIDSIDENMRYLAVDVSI